MNSHWCLIRTTHNFSLERETSIYICQFRQIYDRWMGICAGTQDKGGPWTPQFRIWSPYWEGKERRGKERREKESGKKRKPKTERKRRGRKCVSLFLSLSLSLSLSVSFLSFFLTLLYPPQGGSIRGFFLSVTSSNTVKTGQLRSITVN